MRNNLFHILIICAFTEILTKNEGNQPANTEPVKHTREFFDEEAKNDIEILLSSIKLRKLSADGGSTETLDVPENVRIMARIDEALKVAKSKNTKGKQKTLRYNAQNYADISNGGNMQYVPVNLRNIFQSSSNFDNSNNQFQQFMNRLVHPNIASVKSRISGGHNVNNMLRSQVNNVNVKPKVYPLFVNESNNVNREIEMRNHIDEDELTKVMNKLETNYKNVNYIRTVPISEKFDITKLLNQLQAKRGKIYPTRQKSENNNIRLHDYLNWFYTQSADVLRPGSTLESVHNNFNDNNVNIEPKDKDNSNTIVLRNLSANDQLNEQMNIEQELKTSQYKLPYDNKPSRQGDYRSRKRRFTITRAGYTQDPDTCKTYNENLVKLWSNLSKLINVTEQPNDRDLHNIAMMIQAYLEHQNEQKQAPQTLNQQHERPKDKISEIMLKIRKMLSETNGSAEKITTIIMKYLKPDYTDAENEDCQDDNKEYLSSSVDLLYKNYLENMDCQDEADGVARIRKKSLRDNRGKTGKVVPIGHTTLSLATGDYKPEYQTIHIRDELYNDYHKGKVSIHRPTYNYRRIFKPSRKQKSLPISRSENQNGSGKHQKRSKIKSNSKKLKKNSLKSNLEKSKCEKYATRKLIVSLRPVMERFMGLLECQIDNTLRSVNLDRNSNNPYYLYASKFYSKEDSQPQKKTKPSSLAKNMARIRNNNLHVKGDSSVSTYQDDDTRDDEDFASVRKYSFDETKTINSATPVTRDSSVNNKELGNSDYHTTYNEYFQSPPLYDEYDGIYKTHQLTHSNRFPSLVNPHTSLNKKATREQSSKDPVLEDSDEYDTYYDEIKPEEPSTLLNVEPQTQKTFVETPFIDLTKLRSDDQLIGKKSNTYAKSFESITEFLKRARDSSLQTPEFALPFALDTNKGYVELTHLIKYPKILMYRPQFLVKNTMPYDDFLKTINNINMTNDDVRLMKIVRHLPDSSVQVLFETEDFEAPLEVRNLDENRTGSSDPLGNSQFENRIDTAHENTNIDLTGTDSEDLIPIDANDTRRKELGALIKSDISNNFAEGRLSLHFKPKSDSLRVIEELSPVMYDSDSNSTFNSISNSSEKSEWISPLPSAFSMLSTNNLSSDTSIDIGSTVGPQIESHMKLGTDAALNLSNELNPVHQSQWSSFYNNLISSHPKSKSTIDPGYSQSHKPNFDSSSDSISITNPHSHSLLLNSDASDQKVGNDFSSSTQFVVLRWWRKWRNIVKGKIKQIIGKMASLANKIDHIVRT